MEMLAAEERTALGALAGPRRRAFRSAAETARAALACRVAIDQVFFEVGDLLLTDGAKTDFLISREIDPMVAAEAAAAVLAVADGFATAAPQE